MKILRKTIMNFIIKPVFSFNLNQEIIGNIKFGKYDGIHECLTAATITDKVKNTKNLIYIL